MWNNYGCIFRSFLGLVLDRMFSFSLSLSIPFAFRRSMFDTRDSEATMQLKKALHCAASLEAVFI